MKSYTEREKFEFENVTDCDRESYHLVYLLVDSVRSRGPKPGNLTAPTPVSPLVKGIILLYHVIDWALRTVYQ